MPREPGTTYGAPLQMDEIEALRCLIGNHKYKDYGAADGKGRCITCGKKNGEEEDDD